MAKTKSLNLDTCYLTDEEYHKHLQLPSEIPFCVF